jgi:hypothetical protein
LSARCRHRLGTPPSPPPSPPCFLRNIPPQLRQRTTCVDLAQSSIPTRGPMASVVRVNPDGAATARRLSISSLAMKSSWHRHHRRRGAWTMTIGSS